METRDFFQIFRDIPSVQKVNNLFPGSEQTIFDFVFFVCPRLSGNGLRLNRHKTGFTATYRDGISEYSVERIQRVESFLAEVDCLDGINYTVTIVFASADSFILFPIPVEPPPIPLALHHKMAVVANHEIYKDHLPIFGKFFQQKPWFVAASKLVAKAVQQERQRLVEVLPEKAPENIKEDFIERCFSGFALDGFLLREGILVKNPVILGVESWGVPVLQNSALAEDQRLPVIELK